MIQYIACGKKNPLTQETFYYAQMAPVSYLTMDQIADAVSEVCTVTRHDIVGVLSALQEQIVRAMQNGQSVRLGDLGSFRPTIEASGTPLAKDVTAALVKRIHCRFTPGSMLRHRLSLDHPDVRFTRRIDPKGAVPPDTGGGGDEIL